MITPTEETQHGNPFFGAGVETTTSVPRESSADQPVGEATPPQEVWDAAFPDQRI